MESKRGRPVKGALSSYPSKLVKKIHQIRDRHPGWGAADVLYDLIEKENYQRKDLPGIASVNRYFKQAGLIPDTIPKRDLPNSKSMLKKPKRVHQRWEMDAQGPVLVSGIGHIAMINLKDGKSKAHIMAFPVPVESKAHQPKTIFYQWTLRLSFIEWGLPKGIQVDKDSVFYENRSKSPFPTLLHLWLIGLGIQLEFIKNPPPIQNAMVERSHQTIDKQVLKGQHYQSWKQLFNFCNQRRKLKNEIQTNPYSKNLPPLLGFPSAKKNRRKYSINQEDKLLQVKRIYRYLSKCEWYRKVSSAKTFSLGGNTYYIKQAKPYSQIQIRFNSRTKKLICQDANELIIAKMPLQKVSLLILMGDSKEGLLKMKRNLEFYKECSIKN